MASFFFFCNDTATTEIYTLSLHDALPISRRGGRGLGRGSPSAWRPDPRGDRKSTRLNSSHEWISYAVFCLNTKKRTVFVVLVRDIDICDCTGQSSVHI